MRVNELVKMLEKLPQDAQVGVLFPDEKLNGNRFRFAEKVVGSEQGLLIKIMTTDCFENLPAKQ